jgi:hypothetical protein
MMCSANDLPVNNWFSDKVEMIWVMPDAFIGIEILSVRSRVRHAAFGDKIR